MKRTVVPSLLALGLAVFSVGVSGNAQEDSFLTVYYNDNQAVLCRDYNTANGARLATYQWWLVGFVSGSAHARNNLKLPMARIDAARAIERVSMYCLEKPSETLGMAAASLVASLWLPSPAK